MLLEVCNAKMIRKLVGLAVLDEKYLNPLADKNGVLGYSKPQKIYGKKSIFLFGRANSIREYGRYVFWKDEEKRERYYNS